MQMNKQIDAGKTRAVVSGREELSKRAVMDNSSATDCGWRWTRLIGHARPAGVPYVEGKRYIAGDREPDVRWSGHQGLPWPQRARAIRKRSPRLASSGSTRMRVCSAITGGG